MRVILDLDEIVLGKLQFRADAENRSRKNFMEVVLQKAANGNNPVLERIEYAPEKSESYDGKKSDKYIQDEVGQYTAPTHPLDKVSQFCQNIQYADSKKEIEKYIAQAKKELDWKQQVTVNTYAAEIMEKKGFVYND